MKSGDVIGSEVHFDAGPKFVPTGEVVAPATASVGAPVVYQSATHDGRTNQGAHARLIGSAPHFAATTASVGVGETTGLPCVGQAVSFGGSAVQAVGFARFPAASNAPRDNPSAPATAQSNGQPSATIEAPPRPPRRSVVPSANSPLPPPRTATPSHVDAAVSHHASLPSRPSTRTVPATTATNTTSPMQAPPSAPPPVTRYRPHPSPGTATATGMAISTGVATTTGTVATTTGTVAAARPYPTAAVPCVDHLDTHRDGTHPASSVGPHPHAAVPDGSSLGPPHARVSKATVAVPAASHNRPGASGAGAAHRPAPSAAAGVTEFGEAVFHELLAPVRLSLHGWLKRTCTPRPPYVAHTFCALCVVYRVCTGAPTGRTCCSYQRCGRGKHSRGSPAGQGTSRCPCQARRRPGCSKGASRGTASPATRRQGCRHLPSP